MKIQNAFAFWIFFNLKVHTKELIKEHFPKVEF